MNYFWQLNDDEDLLRKSFSSAVTHLRAPAGDSYRTEEDIQKNEDEFGRAFHRGLFQFHLKTIDYILLVEENIRALPGHLTDEQKTARRGWENIRQILRSFNDCIAWTVLQEPSFTINRLCRHRPRAFLRDQNPTSILKIITDFSQSGETLAIWNDATRCIDLQDITAISFKPREISFYEVKEGQVNTDILAVLNGNDEATGLLPI